MIALLILSFLLSLSTPLAYNCRHNVHSNSRRFLSSAAHLRDVKIPSSATALNMGARNRAWAKGDLSDKDIFAEGDDDSDGSDKNSLKKKRLEPESVFFEGPPSSFEVLFPALSVLTVIGIVPFVSALSRQFWVRYKFTSRRISIQSGVGGKVQTEIIYPDVEEIRFVYRAFGSAGDMHSKLLDWQFHIRRLRDSLSLITGDPVGIEEITSAVSSAVAIESSSIKLLSEDCCSNVFVVCVGYLLNNSSHLHAEARFFSLPAARVEPYGTNFALYSRSLPRAKAVSWIRDRVELSYKRDACGVQETLLYHTGGFVTEGLVSNVAVLSDRGELFCAEEDCLEGSMARIVRIAALRSGLRLEQGKGIPVPWAVGGSGWRAAILCNSARGVIPISHLQLPGKSECDGDDVSSRIVRESGSLYGDGAVMYLNSGADLQVRSIQRLVNSFLNSCAEGDEGEGDEVLAMRQDFRKQYGYDPWTPLSDVIAIASNH
eukprot:gene28712-37704_t